MMEDKKMSLQIKEKRIVRKGLYGIGIVFALALISFGSYQQADAQQKTFKSPEEAVKSLMVAVRASDTKEVLAIFGPTWNEIISKVDKVQDKAARDRFMKAYDEMNKLEKETDSKVTLVVGKEEWPFPIPIVKKGESWLFDTKAGKEELLNRRIGRNELNTIQTCLAYVDAQREYAMKDWGGGGLRAYAQKFMSTPGKKDGLFWKAKEGEEQSPMGAFAAQAVREGYTKTSDKPVPYHGYFYRILKAQGKNAPGGAYDYVVKGKMIGGFALVAYPAEYGSSGIMTFIVNHDGVVYQCNLGSETAKIAGAMKAYDPDDTWEKAE
jgi:Protein of unknown function (DUF2950)